MVRTQAPDCENTKYVREPLFAASSRTYLYHYRDFFLEHHGKFCQAVGIGFQGKAETMARKYFAYQQ